MGGRLVPGAELPRWSCHEKYQRPRREKEMSAQGLVIPQEEHGQRLVGLHDDDDARMNKCGGRKVRST